MRDNKCITDEGLSHLTNLTHLCLISNHNISDKSIVNLTNLITLDISNHHDDIYGHENRTLTDESVKTLTRLEKLTIYGNEMITDRSVSYLTNLRELRRDENQISTDCLLMLTKLRFFD